MATLVRAGLDGNFVTARTINRQFFPLMTALFSEPSPAPAKAVLALLGHCEDTLRLPMVPVARDTLRKLERLLGELGLLNHLAPAGEELHTS